jgi:hypothetical protein
VVNALTLWSIEGMDYELMDNDLLLSFKHFLINTCGHGYLDKLGHAKVKGLVCVNPYHYKIDIQKAKAQGYTFPKEVNSLKCMDHVGPFQLLPDKKTFVLRDSQEDALSSWSERRDSLDSSRSAMSRTTSLDIIDDMNTLAELALSEDEFFLRGAFSQQCGVSVEMTCAVAQSRHTEVTYETTHHTSFFQETGLEPCLADETDAYVSESAASRIDDVLTHSVPCDFDIRACLTPPNDTECLLSDAKLHDSLAASPMLIPTLDEEILFFDLPDPFFDWASVHTLPWVPQVALYP